MMIDGLEVYLAMERGGGQRGFKVRHGCINVSCKLRKTVSVVQCRLGTPGNIVEFPLYDEYHN